MPITHLVERVGDDERLESLLLLLSAVGNALASSPEYRSSLQHVADLIVPAFADGFSVTVEDVVVASAGVGTDSRDTTARPFVHVADEAVSVGDRCYGSVRIARQATGRPFDRPDRLLLGEIALRVATTIDAAHRFAQEHHVADTLQRALLPERLPSPPTHAFDAAYLPGAEEAIVGGDWFDAFVLPDGRIACSIGDVAGHGLRAAIVMGEVRQAFRAAALNAGTPALVLERANNMMNLRANPIMVTAIFATIDPQTSTLTYATAGHPPPLLALPDSTVARLPCGGVPLGITDAIDATDWTFTLPPGAIFTLYTDGLIEHSRDIARGEAELEALAREQVLRAEPSPARTLLKQTFAERRNTDDAAALSITARGEWGRRFRYSFSAIPMAVQLARRSLRRYAEHLGLSDDLQFALLTVVGEALANAVEHAYSDRPGIVTLSVDHEGDRLAIAIEDDGTWKPAQKRDERGRGLPLMRALADSVEIRTGHARTVVRLTLRLDEAEPRVSSA